MHTIPKDRADTLRLQRPQGLIIHFSPIVTASGSSKTAQEAYLGWSGLAAASSLAGSFSTLGGGGRESVETVEVDPEVAMGLGWAEGTIVCPRSKVVRVMLY